jgi:hypothetical protein
MVSSIPLIFFSTVNVTGLYLSSCTATEGGVIFYEEYFFLYQITIFLWVLVYGVIQFKLDKTPFRKQIALITFGSSSFLLLFFTPFSVTKNNDIN